MTRLQGQCSYRRTNSARRFDVGRVLVPKIHPTMLLDLASDSAARHVAARWIVASSAAGVQGPYISLISCNGIRYY